MSREAVPRRTRVATGLLAIVALGLVTIGLGAPGALAHTDLVSTDPIDGSVLTQAPSTVTLTFAEDLLQAAVTISDVSGTVVDSPASVIDGVIVTAPWPEGLPDGSYSVNYRVVSTDGHPVEGALVVAFGAGVSLDPALSGAPASPDDGNGPRVIIAVVIGIAVVTVLATVIVSIRRGRRET